MPQQNQPLVTDLYTADPSAHVFEGKLYIYPSHDLDHDGEDNDNGDQYRMEDYHVYSMDDVDAPIIDHGQALHVKDVPWATKQMWDSDVAFKDGTYYMYFPARDADGIFRIGIATSQNPAGPFKAQPNPIPGSYSIDPAVFTDDDGRTYMYFGGLWGGQLEKWQTGAFVPDVGGPDSVLSAGKPALTPQVREMAADMLSFKDTKLDIRMVDQNGNPIAENDEERRFFEAAWMHKYNGKYYLSYSTGNTHYLAYAIGDSPTGTFVYQGKILQPVIGWTTHHSIVEFKGKWYLFYHDASLSGGVNHKRSMKFCELKYNPDGTIQTIWPYGEQ
jgi:hypothetical protein